MHTATQTHLAWYRIGNTACRLIRLDAHRCSPARQHHRLYSVDAKPDCLNRSKRAVLDAARLGIIVSELSARDALARYAPSDLHRRSVSILRVMPGLTSESFLLHA